MTNATTATAATTATSDLRVTVAPGSGRIARRQGALLFDPSGDNAELMTEFDEATSDEAAIIVVKQHLIDVGFDASPVVVIDWRTEGLALLVFGDADLRTSAAAAPNINGAGSGTWIERQLGALELGDADEVQVWCGDETDDATDLRLGLVRAGGVKITMARAGALAVAPTVAEEAEVQEERRPAIPDPLPESANPRPVPSQVPAAASVTNGSGPVAAVASSASAVATAPVEAGFVAGAAEREWTDTEPQIEPAASVTTVADPFTEPAPSGDEVSRDARPEAQSADAALAAASAGLVEATLCSNGHGNPPRHTICRTCAVEIDPGTEVTLIAQPSLGHLRFADGDVVEVASELLIGRKPASESPSVRPIVVNHAEVSRSHVEVTIDGWSVLVTDRGSRNGTWVIPPSDPTPIKLDAQVPYLLEHGTTVHLGGPEASFSYDFGTD